MYMVYVVHSCLTLHQLKVNFDSDLMRFGPFSTESNLTECVISFSLCGRVR